MIYLVIGLLVGFFVALPVGAVAVLCINRTLQYGIKSGFYTGIGVAAADFFYGTLAVFGLVAVSGESLQNQPVLRLVGGLCIMFIGAQMMAKKIDKIKLVDLQRQDNFKNSNWSIINHKQPSYSIGFYFSFIIFKFSFTSSCLDRLNFYSDRYFFWLSYLVDDTLLSRIEIKR